MIAYKPQSDKPQVAIVEIFLGQFAAFSTGGINMKKSTTPKGRTLMRIGYRLYYTHVPDHPEIVEFVYIRERKVYVNTAADADANIIRLIR